LGRKELTAILWYVKGRFTAGKSTTILDVANRFGWNPKEAQDKLEYLKKRGRIINPYKRRRPQEYYPATATKKMAERGINDERELQEFQNFLIRQGKAAPLLVHNIQLTTKISPFTYDMYEEVPVDPWNKGKRFHANVNGNMVWAYLYPNGTVRIYCPLSYHPFKLQNEKDIDKILVTLGEWRRGLIQKTCYHTFPEPQGWIMTHADFNKDIQKHKSAFARDFHLTVDNVIGSFRMYTKNIENKLVYRVEVSKDFKEDTTVQVGLRWGLEKAESEISQAIPEMT
jgi:hypothetical protein